MANKIVTKIRLYPKKSQKREIFKQFDLHKDLYNKCLEERKTKFEKEIISVSCYEQIKSRVPEFRGLSNCSSLQQTVRRLDKAFQSFFRRCKSGETPGYPRFKSRFKSIEYTYGDGCKIRKNKVYFQHIGEIKAVFHKEISNPSRIILSYNNGCFYASFIHDSIPKILPRTDRSVGIDFGLKNFITTSNGEVIQNPRFHKKLEKTLKKAQSKRSKTDKETKEHKKQTIVISKTWKKIKNCRHNFNHKLTNSLLNQYDTIVIEKLSLNDLKTEIKNINKAYSDVSWGNFVSILSKKAANAAKKVILVNPAYTSKKCFGCGKIHDLTLKDRTMNCDCGNCMDRDHNAALNILGLGLQSLAQA